MKKTAKFILTILMLFLAMLIALRTSDNYGFMPNWWDNLIGNNAIHYFVVGIICAYIVLFLLDRKESVILGFLIVFYCSPNLFLWLKCYKITGESLYLNYLTILSLCVVAIVGQVYWMLRLRR